MSNSLTSKQEAFAVAVARGEKQSDAYRDVYQPKNMTPKTIYEAASRLAKNSKVAARISQLSGPALEAAAVTVERTVKEAACISYSDPGELFDAEGKMIPIHKLPRHVRAAIASWEFDKDTGHISKIKLWDKNSGIERLFKHLGLFERDNGQKGDSIKVQVLLVGPRS